MKRLLAFAGGLCILGSFFAASAPQAVTNNAAAFEAVAMTTTTGTTAVSVEQQKLDFATVEISACEIIREEPGKQGHWEPVRESATIRVEKWFDMGKDTFHTELVDSWDIAESNPHTVTVPGDPNTDGFILFAIMEEAPHGYSVRSGGTPALTCTDQIGWNAASQSYYNRMFDLEKEPYMDADFPIEGTFSARVRFWYWENDPRQRNDDLLFPGLDVVLYDPETGETLKTWNTTDQPEIIIPDLKYRFEDWQMKSTYQYGIRVENLPEGCRVVGDKPYLIKYKKNDYENQRSEIYEAIGIETPESLERMYATLVSTTTTTTKQTATETTTVSVSSTDTGTETTSIMTTSSDTTTVSNTTAATSTTETTAKVPLSDETLCEWAAKDYSDKNQTSVSAEISGREGGKVSITLKDSAGNAVDTYVIDETSGIGENAAGDAVNLPQTGNNAPADYLIAVGALLLTIAGAWVLYSANKRSRINK